MIQVLLSAFLNNNEKEIKHAVANDNNEAGRCTKKQIELISIDSYMLIVICGVNRQYQLLQDIHGI